MNESHLPGAGSAAQPAVLENGAEMPISKTPDRLAGLMPLPCTHTTIAYRPRTNELHKSPTAPLSSSRLRYCASPVCVLKKERVQPTHFRQSEKPSPANQRFTPDFAHKTEKFETRNTEKLKRDHASQCERHQWSIKFVDSGNQSRNRFSFPPSLGFPAKAFEVADSSKHRFVTPAQSVATNPFAASREVDSLSEALARFPERLPLFRARQLAKLGFDMIMLPHSRLLSFWIILFACAGICFANGDEISATATPRKLIRIGAAQPKARLIDYHLADPANVLERVDRSISELLTLVEKGVAEKCDVIAFPEDTLGLGKWEAANKSALKEVLPRAVGRMLERFSQAAASNHVYLVLCNDTIEPDGAYHNTAFFIGRDGRQLGRYHKVNMPIHELDKKRGDRFPVFNTPDLGGVGLLICYDMVFPEAPRCLALGGADIIFHPTLGGAAIGDDDINRAAFRTRAVDNFVYIVVSQRGNGSMIISPQGTILAEAKGTDSLAIADIDPFAGREGGDAMNSQRDMRARLFRERSPAAFEILSDPHPPVLDKIPATISVEEAVEISGRALTRGEEDFKQADSLARQGKTNEAVAAYQKLQKDYRQTWIDHVSGERLAKLGAKQ